ncbi:uncharacterized protein (TIGR02001 family) [Luteibacter sp. PvP120]
MPALIRPGSCDHPHALPSPRAPARRSRAWRGWLKCSGLALSIGLAGMAQAQSVVTSGTVALSSQLVDRAVALTPATPILQGSVTWTTPTGWSLGLAASTRLRAPGRLAESLAQVARSWTLSDDWQVQVPLVYYRYPPNGSWHVYDRVELAVVGIYRDTLTIGVSGAQLVHGANRGPRGAADLGFLWPLADHLTLSLGAGIAQTLIRPRHVYDSDPGHYLYGQAGAIWDTGPWRFQLAHIVNGQHGQGGPSRIAPWTATLSRSF